MREKYLTARFGKCPKVLCENQPVLPIGMSEELKISRVKVFCPRCEDVYIPKRKCQDIDGAYFGCSFPHVLLSVPLIIHYRHSKNSRSASKITCNTSPKYSGSKSTVSKDLSTKMNNPININLFLNPKLIDKIRNRNESYKPILNILVYLPTSISNHLYSIYAIISI